MADRPTQVITGAGVAPTYHAASGGGDRFSPADGTFLHVKNASGSPVTVTVVTTAAPEGLALADQAVSVPAAGERLIKPPAGRLLEDANGLAAITWSSPTSVTFAVLHAA